MPVVIFVPAIGILAVVRVRPAVGARGDRPDRCWATAFWTLTEYWIHRAIFHFEPEDGLGARLHWIIHGVHHDHPNDPLRLVMPPSVSVPLSTLFCLGFWAVLGTPHWYAFGAGFLAGYLLYDMTHYYLHHHKPRTRAGPLAAGAAHAPPLPGRHARLRHQRAVLGQGLRDVLAARRARRAAE